MTNNAKGLPYIYRYFSKTLANYDYCKLNRTILLSACKISKVIFKKTKVIWNGKIGFILLEN